MTHFTPLWKLKRFCGARSGATAIEYALIAGLIAVGLIGGAATLGTDLGLKYTAIAGLFTAGVE
ncbi:Flp family type IVb pilin [Mangrovibrevibacter kandeliae]|uniref:Flp family type IVb pilin n=1 Tax=Mangrovibrevibacter kandeliae TaxID=2968473 RepID=UPI0021180485|nr:MULTISPECIES: Flp family type IVb pilin [unclassified Aurantimonas]MCQ8783519.1 Flp family type IVb pilin [Aurantimonas sp. CSK15Z-1]MCW4115965.1 Flp family type IVb pilin [Aurantimonas sp. MSK8Z-1]